MTTEATKKLLARPQDITDHVRVGEKTYTAIGQDISHISMIVGPLGIVLVDAGASPYAAASVMSKFRKISDKPLKAIILTHSHPDHTGGLAGVIGMELAAHPNAEVDIWARANFGSEFGLAKLLPDIFARRGLLQFGANLDKEQLFPPLGPRQTPDPGKDWPIAEGKFGPNKLFAEDMIKLNVAGLELELHAAPGETSDHLCVWLADEKIAFVGDNMYGSFPNLYAVRGSGYRDVAQWAASLKKIIELGPNQVVMAHSSPLQTRALCGEWLENYHAAIKSIFDQTIEGMNKGFTPDELAATVKLPPHLAAKEYLAEYYGNVAFAVRSIYAGHLGWFDGEAWKLAPLPPADEARHMVELAGGLAKIVDRARQATVDNNPAWAAQLMSYAHRVDPANKDVKTVYSTALRVLGENLLSTSGRNWLLSVAQNLAQN